MTQLLLYKQISQKEAAPGIGGQAGSLHLDLPAAARVLPQKFRILVRGNLHLSEVACCAIAQLPGELAELVSAVAMGRWVGSRHHFGAAQILWPQRVVEDLFPVQPQQLQGFVRHGYEPRFGQRLRLYTGKTSSLNLTYAWLLGRIQGKFSEGDIVEI